jgi:hypothetical protein
MTRESKKGARQESDESCGPQLGSAFPEILKATTKLGTAESDDGVGTADGILFSRLSHFYVVHPPKKLALTLLLGSQYNYGLSLALEE